MKRFLSIFLLMIMLLSLASCVNDDNYGKEFPDLYTEAILSVPWTWGYIPVYWKNPIAPNITILETDSYGRTLYSYDEYPVSNIFGEITKAILICQGSDARNVYYYQNVNFISQTVVLGTKMRETEFDNMLSADRIEELKRANDWEKPLNYTHCVSSAFLTHKPDDGISKEQRNAVKTALKSHYETDHPIAFINVAGDNPATRDSFGRYCLTGQGEYSIVLRDDGKKKEYATTSFHFAIILNPDFSFDPETSIFDANPDADIFVSWEENNSFQQFLKANHWNEPIS